MELKKCENGSIYKNTTLCGKTFIEKSSPVPLKRSEKKGKKIALWWIYGEIISYLAITESWVSIEYVYVSLKRAN